jgi:hypothetical protein
MALLDKDDMAAEAARRAGFRLNHVGTKLNRAELRAVRTARGEAPIRWEWSS